MNNMIEAANRMLSSLGEVQVAVHEYHRMHGQLHLAISPAGRYTPVASVYLLDCISIHGVTAGGPWILRAHEDIEHGRADDPDVVLVGGTEFRVRSKTIKVRAIAPNRDEEPGGLPEFPFSVPSEYTWLARTLSTYFGAYSALHPWSFLEARTEAANSAKQSVADKDIYPFAEQEQRHEVASFAAGTGEPRVMVTRDGAVVAEFQSFALWFKAVTEAATQTPRP
jgi:hypothetical protein